MYAPPAAKNRKANNANIDENIQLLSLHHGLNDMDNDTGDIACKVDA